jgi:SWI/SNF-related matrix-associated actin-dependent regulator of chromatin subfamily A member 5
MEIDEEEEQALDVEDTTVSVTEPTENDALVDELAKAEDKELEAAQKERLELIAFEQNKMKSQPAASAQDRLQYLLAQSDVFAHFLAGSVAATDKKGKKKGSRGKTGRLTEAEEDEQLLKSAESARRTIRVDKQPSILAPHCKMHGYQLEGLNWLIKLHDHGINGILADEMVSFKRAAFLHSIFSENERLRSLPFSSLISGSRKDSPDDISPRLSSGISWC